MEDVFINYRTGDGDEAAVLIDRELSERFGREQVFLAARSVPVGAAFPEALLGAVRKSRVLLAVIGPDWVRNSLLHNEKDWVRREIEEAFRCGAVVIPIMKGRKTERLRVADLPQGLVRLADAQSLRLDIHDSAADLMRIGDELTNLVPALRAADRHVAKDQPPPGDVRNTAANVEGSSVQAHAITGDVGYVFKGNAGQINMGTQNYYDSSQSLSIKRYLSPRQQAVDQFRWLAERFVEPENLGVAREKLENHRAVFLDALPGSGRVAAAQMLLWELRSDAGDVQELLPQERESRFNLEQIGDGDRVWIDLSARADIWSDAHAELSSLKVAIDKHDAYFVLILPAEAENMDSSLSQYRVRISKPSLVEVLSRYLKIDGIPQPSQISSLSFVRENRPLREVARYAELIREAREKGTGGGDFNSWCAAASQALANRDREVTKLVAELGRGPQRALLLATAMLHGAHADSICRASQALLRIVNQPDHEDPVLERETLDRQFKAIGAERDISGCVRFAELDYDSAIRGFFWTYLPEIRPSMPAWVEQTVDLASVSDEEREKLIRRFCDQALSDRYQSILFKLVERWTSDRSAYRRIQSAAIVLESGLSGEHSGRAFRRKIYDWASTSSLSDQLAEVIIAACRDEMAVTHPAEAMVRLHHVARHETGFRAREALFQLAESDRRFFRQMLIRLTETERRWPIDAELFLQLIEPGVLTDSGARDHSLLAEEAVRRQLIRGWGLIFKDQAFEIWQPRAQEWLHFAAAHELNRDAFLNILVEASLGYRGVAARLFTMSCGQEMLGAISDLILQKINKAQDVDFF